MNSGTTRYVSCHSKKGIAQTEKENIGGNLDQAKEREQEMQIKDFRLGISHSKGCRICLVRHFVMLLFTPVIDNSRLVVLVEP